MATGLPFALKDSNEGLVACDVTLKSSQLKVNPAASEEDILSLSVPVSGISIVWWFRVGIMGLVVLRGCYGSGGCVGVVGMVLGYL